MSGLMGKLKSLSSADGPARVQLTELTNDAGYKVVGARFYQHPTYGQSIIITMLINGEEQISFLPKRYAKSLSEADLDSLSAGDYKIKCVGVKNGSPQLEFFK